MYIIIETEDGLTIQRQPEGMTANQVAADCGGILADEGPYHSYEDASDAIFVCARSTSAAARAAARTLYAAAYSRPHSETVAAMASATVVTPMGRLSLNGPSALPVGHVAGSAY